VVLVGGRSEYAAVLDFTQFALLLVEATGIDHPGLAETTTIDSLELDSLQVLELLLVMDELGAEVVEDMVPAVDTVSDLYSHYVTRVTAESRGS
jgi:acyl carrier protein